MVQVQPENHIVNPAEKAVEMTDLLLFVNLLKKMLMLNAAQRITPSQVLEHNFIMCHIVRMYPLSSQ